jgi:rare lipoprotein A
MFDLNHLNQDNLKVMTDNNTLTASISRRVAQIAVPNQDTFHAATADSATGRQNTSKAIFRSMRRAALLSAVVGFGLSAVAADRPNVTTAPVTHTSTTVHHWLQTGVASWYGTHFQGHKTANGEHFDMNSLTCAHRSLPLGSWIRVTNLHNRKSVFVRVNDRGPMAEGRIIDLSYAAAHAVGLAGVGRVKLEQVRDNDPEMARELTAQLHMPAPLIPVR